MPQISIADVTEHAPGEPAMKARHLTLLAIGVATIVLSNSNRSAADTIGNALISRTGVDGCNFCLVVVNQAFAGVGEVVTSWSFVSINPGDTIAPILFSLAGNTFTVTGTGTAEAGAPGVDTFNFGLTSGTNITGPATYIGWQDSSFTGASIPFDTNGGVPNPGTYFTHTGPVSVGTQFDVSSSIGPSDGQLSDRIYSVQFTASSVGVPGPTAGTGLPGLLFAFGGFLFWRRRSKASRPLSETSAVHA
jgi:hypothetical protein